MNDSISEKISNIRRQIDNNNMTIGKINRMQSEMEEAHLRRLKRIEEYSYSESLTFSERQDYADKRMRENREFMEINDEYESAIRKINSENEEKEEEIRQLNRQQDEKEDNQDSEEDNG